jgi:hypothetical protein
MRAILRAMTSPVVSNEDDAGEDDDVPAGSGRWTLDDLMTGLDADARKILVEWIAHVVERAHATSPNCWNMTRVKRTLRVNVGRNVSFEFRPPKIIGVGLHLPSLTDSASDIPPVPRLKEFSFVDVENSVLRCITLEHFLAHHDALRPAADRFIEGSAKAFANTPFARYHAPDLLAEVEHAFGSPMPHPTHEAASTAASYWKVAPGAGADRWPQCRDGGYIAIGWGEFGDLTGVTQAQLEEKHASLREALGWGPSGPRQVWQFRNIPVGAKIVANRGQSRVLGIGTVTGPYYYDDINDVEALEPFPHRLPVRWDDLRERVVNQGGWATTLRRIQPAAFEQILSAPSPGQSGSPIPGEESMQFEGLLERMKSQRLHFSPDLIASYLLALQAKRFVILSGISGTGKTQLALTIAKAFQPSRATAEKTKLVSGGGHRLRVKPYMLEHHRLVVPAVLADRIDIGEGPGHIEVRFGDGGSESLRWSPQPSQTQILFKKGSFRSWFAQLEVGDEIELRVEDEADTPALWIDRVEQSRATAPSVVARTFELVAVRPDWTDNRGLLGYFNPITRDYQSTAFLRLLLRAAEEADDARRSNRPAVPYFVILDEMNLARVEHYFSDFLSALESQEPLELHDNERVEEGGSGTGEAVPRRVTIPPNLYFTGTVNVDETTYMFSPKVLDRAFVLEFNEVNLDGVGKDLDVDAGLRLDVFLGLAEASIGDEARDVFSELLDGELHRAMLTLNDRLELDHRHFGYRVAKEIACFVTLAAAQAGEDSDKLWHAFDIAILSKVLPKLHGTQQELGELLERLLAFTINANSAVSARGKESEWDYIKGHLVSKSDAGPPKLPRSAAKLWRMLRRVRLQGYVSFIE